MTRRRLVGGLAAVLAVAGAALFSLALLRPATGTVVLLLSGAEAQEFQGGRVEVHSASGWRYAGGVPAAHVAAAPDASKAAEMALPAGRYDRLRLAGSDVAASLEVAPGLVQPLLVAMAGGSPIAGGVYSGTDEVNLGLAELGGKLVRAPDFSLVDQDGQPVTASGLRGTAVVVAAFHTTCRETCPLYTGLYLELQRLGPTSVRLLEVTTDPDHDTPAALRSYARAVGARWTFATGDPAQLSSLWTAIGAGLATGDSHASTLAVIDAHGYVRIVYRGVPSLSSALPQSLRGQLSAAGAAQAASRGDFDAAQLTDVLHRIAALPAPQASSGGTAADISLPGLNGGSVSLAALRGRPVVVNFWASWCAPCRTELPLLQRFADAHPEVSYLLVDWRDDPGAARALASALGLRLPLGSDPDGRTGPAYAVGGLPATVFVRPDGTVEGRVDGQLTESVLRAHSVAIAGPR